MFPLLEVAWLRKKDVGIGHGVEGYRQDIGEISVGCVDCTLCSRQYFEESPSFVEVL
jgi:hypothetical protein